MGLKNAREAAESQQRGKAAERQRREEEVPVNVVAVNTTGPCASVTSAMLQVYSRVPQVANQSYAKAARLF